MTSQARIIRILAGLVAGVAGAIVLMMLGDTVAHQIVPPPAGPDVYAAANPTGPATRTLIALVLAWLVAALAGGWIAIKLSRAEWTAWAVAGVIIRSAAYLFAQVAHPLWTMAAGIAAPLLGAWLAQRLVRQRQGA